MSKPKPKYKYATVEETKWAMSFLKYLGATDTRDPYLLQTLIAWMRAEGGLKAMRGNNPLNLALSPFAHGYVWDAKHQRKIARFKTLDEAAKAYAWWFKNAMPAGWGDYGELLVNAIKRAVGTEQERANRAYEVRQILATLGWSGQLYNNHYGFNGTSSKIDEIFGKIGGVTFPPEKETKTVRRVIPPVPRAIRPPVGGHIYADPWEAGSFYRGRRHIYSYSQSGLTPPKGIEY